MALTAEQLADMQADLGITDDETVFTDAELERLFVRATENYALAVFYGYRQLLAHANKYRDYTAGLTGEKLSQVRKHLAESLEMWRDEARGAGNQVLSLGLTGVPPEHKELPRRGELDAFDRELFNVG